MAQRFQLSNGPWTCGEIAIHIAKWGSPTDNVVVSLYSDSGSDTITAMGAVNEPNSITSTRYISMMPLTNDDLSVTTFQNIKH